MWNHLASENNTTVGKLGIDAARIADLAKIVADGRVSAGAAARIAEEIHKTKDGPPRSALEIAQAAGLVQERDESAVRAWVEEALAANPKAIADALENPKKAKAAVGFLRGQVMKLSQGKADPKLAGELIQAKLDELEKP